MLEPITGLGDTVSIPENGRFLTVCSSSAIFVTVNHRCIATSLLVFVTIVPCWGCGGFGLGGGGEFGVLPSALEMERPDTKATFSGTVCIEEAALPGVLERFRVQEGEGGRPRDLSIVLTGPRGTWRDTIDEDGEFSFSGVYAGRYDVILRCGGYLMARLTVFLREGSSVIMALRVLGDHPGVELGLPSLGPVVFEYDLTVSERDTDFVRTVWPDGATRTVLSDGTVEYWFDGAAQVRRTDGYTEYRLDDRPTDGGFRPPSSSARSLSSFQMVTGDVAFPFIEDVELSLVGDTRRSPSEAGLGDLLLVTARISEGGGPPLAEVECRIHGADGSKQTIRLHDDGGEVDLMPDWPGIQVSGDRKRGDGVWSAILPIDMSTSKLLYDSLILIQGRNRRGRSTNIRAIPFSCRVPSDVGSRIVDLGTSMGEFELVDVRRPGYSPYVEARLPVATTVTEGLTVGLVLPDGRTRLMTPRDLEGSWTVFRSSPLDGIPGLYVVKTTSRAGAVYYAGFPLRGE